MRTFLDAPRKATAPGIERTPVSPHLASSVLVVLLYRLRAHFNVQFMYGDAWCWFAIVFAGCRIKHVLYVAYDDDVVFSVLVLRCVRIMARLLLVVIDF